MNNPEENSKAAKGEQKRRISPNLRVVLLCLIPFSIMVGLVCAAEPLYNIFCSATGYGGTTQSAPQYSDVILDREVTVRFDGNTANIPWSFKPLQTSMKLKVGQSALAYFRAHNPTNHPIVGRASYNVTPAKAGLYFVKVQCFCFTEQVLMPGETADMPVSFFVDPAMDEDREMDDVLTITLSYTFFEATDISDESKQLLSAFREKGKSSSALQ